MKNSKSFWLDIVLNGWPFFGSVPVCRRPNSSEYWCEDEAYSVQEHYSRNVDDEREGLDIAPETPESQAAYARFEEAVCATAKRLAKLPYGSSREIEVNGDLIKLTKAKRDECGCAFPASLQRLAD